MADRCHLLSLGSSSEVVAVLTIDEVRQWRSIIGAPEWSSLPSPTCSSDALFLYRRETDAIQDLGCLVLPHPREADGVCSRSRESGCREVIKNSI